MRCILGNRKLRWYSKLLGKSFISGSVRGNRNHAVRLCTAGGDTWIGYSGRKESFEIETPLPLPVDYGYIGLVG